MKPYTFEIIPEQASKDIPAWRLGIMDADGGVVASSVVYSRPTAIKWAERCEHEWDFDMNAAREAIRVTFFGPEKTDKNSFSLSAYPQTDHPQFYGPVVFLVVHDYRGNQIQNLNTNDMAKAEEWSARQVGCYGLDPAAVDKTIREAFAAIKPEPAAENPPIDAEFKVIEDGGTAFPCSHGNEHFGPGMSLRDWFAGQALIAVCGQHCGESPGISDPKYDAGSLDQCESIVERAYQLADLMIARRLQSK
jgi:hypothetical protein